MTYFAVWATDGPDAGDIRTRVREAHRARLRAPRDDGLRVLHGGPTLDADGAMNGSLLIIEARDIESVQAFVAGDPYVLEGVYASFQIRPWHWGLGRPAGAG